MFHALVSGRLQLSGYEIEETLHDVETLNRMAIKGALDVTKMSFHAWLRVEDRYRLLQSGAALGYNCGPVLVAKRPVERKDVPACRIVLPGEWTTAHLLFRLWAPDATDKLFVPYDRIFDALNSGDADCGVIIHESRFTFEQAGFCALADLGAWWEGETGLPIPLGCIAVKDTVPDKVVRQLDTLIHKSILHARAHPEESLSYTRQYAQEMEEEVLQKHIRTFVNEFSLDLGDTGRTAVEKLEQMAVQAGILS